MNLCAQILEALEVSELLGKIVVQFGNLLLLDGFDLDFVLESLTG